MSYRIIKKMKRESRDFDRIIPIQLEKIRMRDLRANLFREK